ncbi:MAG: hypothetical protein EPN93_07060 [Spirochaetes bacterium]|nr:MAG: hypothetical protein EPN93_07060 [Spirochaetota bacterium]
MTLTEKVRIYAALARTWALKAKDFILNLRSYEPVVREKIELVRRSPGIEEYARYYAAAAYIPYVGWLLPLYLKRGHRFCEAHGRNGFTAAVAFAGVELAVFFLNLLFVPRDWRPVSFFLVLVIYLLHLAYFTMCAWGMREAYREKNLEIPVLGKYTGIIEF